MRWRYGFTLVELLVVIAIIGILISLLLPAVQGAREAARKTQCKNNLKQMSVAFLHHESTHDFFPTGGWGFLWIGEPDIGYDAYQPGGWAYNILAYLEYGSLRELGAGLVDNQAHEEALTRLVGTPIPMLSCPSKRPLGLYPMSPSHRFLANNLTSCSSDTGCHVFRSDYRANSGSIAQGETEGPPYFFESPKNRWKSLYRYWIKNKTSHNGICYVKSMVRVLDVTDGAAHTAMVGEKALKELNYLDGESTDDDQCAYTGFDRDVNGFTGHVATAYQPLLDPPPRLKRNELEVDTSYRFGSAHPDGFHMAFCDGAVHFLDYDIDGRIFVKFGGRNDE